MQLIPPGIPFPQEMGGTDAGSSAANVDPARFAVRSPTARMNQVRRISGDFNLPSTGKAPASRTWYLTVVTLKSARARRTASSAKFAPDFVETPPGLACGVKTQAKGSYESINRSMVRALPVCSSQSITTAQRRASPVAGSNRTGIPFRNLPTTNSFFTPITPS